jgi:hypothetical protein
MKIRTVCYSTLYIQGAKAQQSKFILVCFDTVPQLPTSRGKVFAIPGTIARSQALRFAMRRPCRCPWRSGEQLGGGGGNRLSRVEEWLLKLCSKVPYGIGM